MSQETSTIVNKLYEQYYQSDRTPREVVSSYWQDMHKKSRVKIDDNKNFDLFGVGFGDFEYKSLHHQILSWATNTSYLFKLKDRNEISKTSKKAKPLLKRLGFPFSYDSFRFICTLTLISQKIPQNKAIRVINIGDGYGFLSALIKEVYPNAKLCLVDLGKTLLFQANYCHKAHPKSKHLLITNNVDKNEMNLDPDFIYCPVENLTMLDPLTFDLAINIASMEEMNEQTVRNYFFFLRNHMVKDNLFYCCNREEKTMRGGEVSRFLSYPWENDDRHLVDELCPWHEYFFALHPSGRGPKMFNLRIPFVNYFDGSHRHRLTVLKTTD